jgi:hypothetical protein
MKQVIVIAAGVWILAQTLRGNALYRLGVLQ